MAPKRPPGSYSSSMITEAVDRPPTCLTCKHCNTRTNFPTCQRAKVFDVVSGETVDPRICRNERRAPGRWFGRDRCGPDGIYWEEHRAPQPPTGGSAVKPPVAKSR